MVNKVKNKKNAPTVEIPISESKNEYEHFIEQIELENIHLGTIHFNYENEQALDFEKVDDYFLHWEVTYDNFPGGFKAYADIILDVMANGKDGPYQPFGFELGFNIWYRSDLKFLEEEYKVFDKTIIMPLVWPYFRETARDIFSKAGIYQIRDIPLGWW